MTGKYVRKTDADRIKDRLKAALGSLGEELVQAITDKIVPGVTAAAIEAVMNAEVRRMLKAADQVEAAMLAQLDAVAIDGDDV